jgi:TorA maturation chaperone TorD
MDGHGCEGNQGMKKQSLKNTASRSLSTNEWHNQALSRSNCYGLLAVVFRDTPSCETVTQLTTPPLVEILNDLGCNVTQHLAGELQAVTACLHEQYTQTFIGPKGHVPLYASVYRNDEGRLWGDSTVWVKRFIERTGLSFENNWDSIPDHITVELELMQRLTACEAQLWLPDSSHGSKNTDKQLCQCLQMQEQFLSEHLCVWIPQFCERVLEASTSLFYQEMVRLTKSLVFSDVEQVKAAQNILRYNLFAEYGRRDDLSRCDMDKDRTFREENT